MIMCYLAKNSQKCYILHWFQYHNTYFNTHMSSKMAQGLWKWHAAWFVWKSLRLFLGAWWRHQMETFSRNWPFVRGIHRSPVTSPHKGQWRGALMFSLICVWINDWVNNREAGDLRRYRTHYDVIVMCWIDDRWISIELSIGELFAVE